MIRTTVVVLLLSLVASVGAQSSQPKTVAPASSAPSIMPTPWFTNQQIQGQLRFTDQQRMQLQQAYTNAWQAMNQGMKDIPSTFNEAQRLQRLRELEQRFYNNFADSSNKIITDAKTIGAV